MGKTDRYQLHIEAREKVKLGESWPIWKKVLKGWYILNWMYERGYV